MGRRRRLIKSNHCYELCFRARQGLPLVAYNLVNFLISSILARVQRDNKVTLCHDIWNGSHAHLIIVAHDAEQCRQFYGQVQKKLTEGIKRLLGLRHLNLWEGTPLVAELPDFETVKNRIVYLYSNPAQDNLEESIERFPGYSSWQDYKRCLGQLADKVTNEYPWIRLPTIPRLSSPVLSSSQDARLVNELFNSNRETMHELTREPNRWMKCFDVFSEEDVSQINQEILNRIKEHEHFLLVKRNHTGQKVIGAKKLRYQPIMKNHQPKKYSRKVFVITSVNQLRTDRILERKHFSKRCTYCYQRWKIGDYSVEWPPGAFKPPMPPHANRI